MVRKNKKTSTMSPRGMMLFALPFFAVGLGMGGCNAWTVSRHHAAQSWVEVPAVIQQAKLEEHDSDDGTTYKATATYTYEFGGRRYTGDRVSLHSGSDNIGTFQRDAHRELKRHRDTGQPFHCYVNPEDPQEAVLYRHPRWEMMLMFAAIAGLFGSVGVGMLVAGWDSRRRTTTPADQVPADQPWLARADWATGRIPATGATAATPVFIAIAVWWNVASLPLLAALPAMLDEAGTRWVWLALLVPTIGAVLVLAALYQAIRRRKFGQSVFELARGPGVVGGPLAGVVHISAAIQPAGGFHLKLCCLRRTRDSDGDIHENVVWNDEQLVTRMLAAGSAGETAVPVLLAIPYSARPSSPPHEETGIRWLLELTAAVPGVDYRAEFEVPVFKTADSRPDFQLDPALAAEYLSQPDAGPLLAEASIKRESLGADGVRLLFGMLRNPGMAISLALFTALWSAIVWVLVHFDAPIIFPIVFGLFDLLFIWITLDLWLYRSVVEASPRGLLIRGGWLGVGISHLFPPQEIDRFTAERNMSSGRSTWNTLYVHLKSGKRHSVAKAIGSRLVERALIDELEAALGRKTNADAKPQLWIDVGSPDARRIEDV